MTCRRKKWGKEGHTFIKYSLLEGYFILTMPFPKKLERTLTHCPSLALSWESELWDEWWKPEKRNELAFSPQLTQEVLDPLKFKTNHQSSSGSFLLVVKKSCPATACPNLIGPLIHHNHCPFLKFLSLVTVQPALLYANDTYSKCRPMKYPFFIV